MEELNKGMMFDTCASTDAIDSQGERLNIEGCDISTLETGMGRVCDNHGKSFVHAIGRVVGAKKIFKAEDCDDDRQKMYWDKVKKPYIYVKGELYDSEDHPNAKATAAILRHLSKAGAPLSVRASVEGSVLARKEGGILDRTKVHSIALTFTPANKETLVMPISLEKSDDLVDWETLCKSVTIAADAPSFIEKDFMAQKFVDATNAIISLVRKVSELKKTLSAGYAASSNPSSLVGGSVLTMPSVDKLYTNCTACGKKQIVRKSQVKCDHCGESWSMSKIMTTLLE